jgi:hypothetical protein
MPSRRFIVYPQGGGVPLPAPSPPPVYNWANDIVLMPRQRKSVVRGEPSGYKAVSGVLQNSGITVPPSSYLGAPRTARYMIGGNQAFVGSPSAIAAEALINLSIFQNFNGLEQSMVSTYGKNFPQVLAAIATAAATAGNTYCKQVPYHIMECASNTGGANQTLTVQYNAVNTNNWFLRTSWPSGSLIGQGTANTNEVNCGTQTSVVSTTFGNVNYAQWFAYYCWNLFHLGNGGTLGESTYPVACSAWAGDFNDNFFNATRQTGAWGNNTTSYVAGNATSNAYLQKGQAQHISQRRALNTDLQLANCDWFSNTGAVYDPSMLNILDGQLCEYTLGNFGNSAEKYMNFSTLVSQLLLSASNLLNARNITMIGHLTPDQTTRYWPTSQSSWIAEDWQGMRFGIALAAILDMFHAPSVGSTSGAPTPTYPAQLNSILRADEYGGFASGPGLNWLQTPIDSVATAIVPWQGSYAGGNAVLRRRWVEGTVYLFPYGNSGPVSFSASGHYLATQGYGDPTVNTGAAFTSITGQVRDAIFTLP